MIGVITLGVTGVITGLYTIIGESGVALNGSTKGGENGCETGTGVDKEHSRQLSMRNGITN